MTVNTEILIADLIETTRRHLNQIEKFKQLSEEALNYKTNSLSWSVLECIEHLNLYGGYYLPEIEHKILNSKYGEDTVFKSGILGSYFAKLMLPKEKTKKMKTPKDKNPVGRKLEKSVIDCFIQQQQKMLELLDKARSVSLTRTKTSISISKMIKLKLGDTFRFVINHNQRHLIQAENVLKKQPLE